ncbi:MAG: circularly permuted type 2 ATP-grasp protein, partial [Verrucomicrobiaceae bacterium]
MQQSLSTPPTSPSVAAGTPPVMGCLSGYRPEPGVYDEMMERSGELRPHWKLFGQMLAQHGAAELRGRHETIQRMLRDHGVTYNIYDDASGTVRPWALDLMPFIVAPDDWRKISAGLSQRTRLLNLILADVYGAQRLLKEGRLPPSLIYANPGYLRPVQGIAPPGGSFLVTMGTDLVRNANGAWMVLADRTQAPSGKGYTLENRIILSNIFPEEFNACHVQRLAGFFEVERESFRSLAPSRRGTPSVVLHSPGPYNETYFEHAFKARYLGFPLVEGADLTVRDRRLHLKTLEGLRRVDVIVRRVDDSFCDPLELRSDALLGIPGLVEAWRSGNVSIVNGLGTGVIETPAIHPFLPGLCRHLLGEELMLPSVPTWWCGQKRELQMVLSNPERWVVKPAFAHGTLEPIFLAKIDSRKRTELLEQIRSRPHNWVAQEVLSLSTTPAFVDGTLQPRSLVWRTFTNASRDNYNVMQGGLTRISPATRGLVVTMQSGGISKDTWVLTDGEVEQITLLPSQPVALRPARPPGGVPSRVADHLFWLGRYAERLEQTVRILRTMMQRLTGEGSDQQSRELKACVQLLGSLNLDPDMEKPLDFNTIRSMARKIVEDPKKEGGICDLLNRVRFNAAAARDRLSDDTWRLLN